MSEILFISLINLIQHPDTYDGKTVRVIGICSFKFEGKAMWASKEDLENAVTKNAVWLDVALSDELRRNDGKYMIVEGVFNKRRNGHLGMYSGTIEKISRIDPWQGDQKSPQ